jgi:GAF domain-containing protein
MIAQKFFSLKSLSDKKQYIENGLRTEKGGLYLNGAIRLLVLAVIFSYNQFSFNGHPAHTLEFNISLLFFFFYNALVGILGILYNKWFLKKLVKFLQVICEIAFYTAFIIANGKPTSDLIWLYIIPIFIAAHYINIKGFIAALGTISICLFLAMSAGPPGEIDAGFFYNYTLRLGALWIIGFFMALRPPPSVKEDVLSDVAPLNTVLQSFHDGIFIVDSQQRLIYVNDTLQAVHGPFVPHEKPHVYFSCHSSLFSWEGACGQKMVAPVRGEFTGQDNRSYKVEVAIHAVCSEIGQATEYIVTVKNLNQDEKVQRELQNQVDRLFEERKIWFNTYYQLGKSLLIYQSLDGLTAFLVGEVRRRLGAEHAAIFFVKDEQLLLQDSGGIPLDEIAGEHYDAGQGITGKLIEPGPNFARPVRLNKVPENVEKQQAVYERYRSLLPSHEVRHLLAVPLISHEGPFGVLRVLNHLDQPGILSAEGFSQEEEDLLIAIAAMASVAIQNIRLLDETTLRYEKLKVLYEMVEKISNPYELDELFQVIVDEARRHVPSADKCSIYQIHGDELIAQATSEAVKRYSGLPPMKVNEGIAGLAIQAGTSIYVKDSFTDEIFVQRGGENPRTLLVSPLVDDGRVFGTLTLNSLLQSAFSQNDLDFIDTLGYHAAIALRQARLVRQLQERTEQAEALNQVFVAINKKIDLPSLLTEIIEQISPIVPFDSISIQLKEGKFLKIRECRGFDDDSEVRKLRFPLQNKKYPNSIVMEKLEPVIIADVLETYPHFQREHSKFHSGKIRSWMGIPLVHRKKGIGVISFDSVTPNFYDEKMKALAMSIANALSSAIANAYLFDEKQKQFEHIKRLGEDLSQLYEASKVLNQMTSIASVCQAVVDQAHHLVNPDHTALILVDSNGYSYAAFESEEFGRPILECLRETGITRDVINSGMPFFMPHIRPGDDHNPWIYEHGFHSYAVVPIYGHQGKVVAVLSAHSKKGNAFACKEQLLETFCKHAAASIENAFHQQEKEEQSQAQERMLAASTRLLESVGIEDVLSIAVESVKEIFGIDNSLLYLADDARENLRLIKTTSRSVRVNEIPPIPMSSNDLIAITARKGGKPVVQVCRDPRRIGQPIHLGGVSSRNPEGRSLMLIGRLEDNQDQCVGVLSLETAIAAPWKETFSEFEQNLFITFISLIGIAIERAQLTRQLNNQARKEARDLLSRDLHELEGILMSTVLMRTEVAHLKYQNQDYNGVVKELEMVAKAARNIQQSLFRIHNDLKNDVDIHQKGLLPTLESLASMQSIEVVNITQHKVDLPSHIEYALYKIGVEALNNICKHAGKARTIISLDRDEDGFVFQVSDCGPGFDLEEVLTTGGAFGLDTMQRWAEKIDARINTYSNHQDGTLIDVRGKMDLKGGEM